MACKFEFDEWLYYSNGHVVSVKQEFYFASNIRGYILNGSVVNACRSRISLDIRYLSNRNINLNAASDCLH